MEQFSKHEHIERMQPHADKLLQYLAKKDIEFLPADGNLENIILRNKDREIKIAHHCFYRYSGIACIYKDGQEKNSIETIEVTDDMFMNSYMKAIVDALFAPNKK